MNNVINFFYSIMPLLDLVAAIAFVLKIILAVRHRSFTLTTIVLSFFRIYSKFERSLTMHKRKLRFMLLNNYLNFYLYSWIVIALLIFFIAKGTAK